MTISWWQLVGDNWWVAIGGWQLVGGKREEEEEEEEGGAETTPKTKTSHVNVVKKEEGLELRAPKKGACEGLAQVSPQPSPL